MFPTHCPYFLSSTNTGIGEAIVRTLLADSSNRVVAVARSGDQLAQLEKEFSGRVTGVSGDVSERETSVRAVRTAVDNFGQLDAVVANAGMLHPVGNVGDLDVGEWRRLFDVNFFSVVHLVQAALPELRKSLAANFVAVLLGASRAGYVTWGPYGLSKAALDHLMKTVAAEEPLVHSIAIAPGVVDTEMQGLIRDKYTDVMKSAADRFIELHKLGSLLKAEVPGKVLAQLAVKGWTKEMNGGYYRYNDEEVTAAVGK